MLKGHHDNIQLREFLDQDNIRDVSPRKGRDVAGSLHDALDKPVVRIPKLHASPALKSGGHEEQAVEPDQLRHKAGLDLDLFGQDHADHPASRAGSIMLQHDLLLAVLAESERTRFPHISGSSRAVRAPESARGLRIPTIAGGAGTHNTTEEAMHTVRNLTPGNIARSIGTAARMRPSGVVNIMLGLRISGEEAAGLYLDHNDPGEDWVFVPGGFTAGEVVNGKLLCALPLSSPPRPTYVLAAVDLNVITGGITLDGVTTPKDTPAPEWSTYRFDWAFEGRVRRMLREGARLERESTPTEEAA